MRKKVHIVILMLCFFTTSYQSESQAFKEGNKYMGLNFGLDSYYRSVPFAFVYEYGIKKDISIGVILDLNYASYPSDIVRITSDVWKYKAFNVGLRSSYHFNKIIKNDKVDLYIGGGVGFQYFKWRERYFGQDYTYQNGFSLDYHVGTRYLFSDVIAGNVEWGSTGMSTIRIGFSLKLE